MTATRQIPKVHFFWKMTLFCLGNIKHFSKKSLSCTKQNTKKIQPRPARRGPAQPSRSSDPENRAGREDPGLGSGELRGARPRIRRAERRRARQISLFTEGLQSGKVSNFIRLSPAGAVQNHKMPISADSCCNRVHRIQTLRARPDRLGDSSAPKEGGNVVDGHP